MKKQLILAITILLGGLALPASAQVIRHHGNYSEVFISGYRSCGTPIYAKRVHYGRSAHVVPLNGYELRRYLDRQQRIAAQRAYERRLAQERYNRSRYIQRSPYVHRSPYSGRCR